MRIAVTSPSFCSSSVLMDELTSIPGIEIYANRDLLRLEGSSLLEFLSQSACTGLIIGTEKLPDYFLSELPHLKAIFKYGVGLDNLDLNGLKRREIFLGWTGGVNRRSVSELTLAFSLGHMRNVFSSIHLMEKGIWKKSGGQQLSEKVFGIVGYGAVGSDVSQLIKAFGCRILACDILDKKESLKDVQGEQVSYEEILASSDIISFHVPLTNQTRHMFSFDQAKKTTRQPLIINTSRGEVVDFPSSVAALKQNYISGLALDVFPEEPFDASSYSAKDGFYFTPHIGGNASEAVRAMGRSAIIHLKEYLKIYGV